MPLASPSGLSRHCCRCWETIAEVAAAVAQWSEVVADVAVAAVAVTVVVGSLVPFVTWLVSCFAAVAAATGRDKAVPVLDCCCCTSCCTSAASY